MHYSRLFNVKFDHLILLLAVSLVGVSIDMIRKALCKIKGGKAAGPSNIGEMMKKSGDEGI